MANTNTRRYVFRGRFNSGSPELGSAPSPWVLSSRRPPHEKISSNEILVRGVPLLPATHGWRRTKTRGLPIKARRGRYQIASEREECSG